MPDHTYAVKIGSDTYDVSSPTELTDVQAYQAALAQSTAAPAAKTEVPKPAFVPPTGEFLSRMGDAAVSIPTGMTKTAGRLVQAIPGVAAATDKLYGLPSGASKQAMQPANANEQAGGYLGDLALMAATGGAEAGPAMLARGAGYVSNPTVAGRAAAFTGDTLAAVRAQLSAGGPVTPDKVAGLIVKYGKEVVKTALVATAGYSTWRAVRHLF